MQKNQYRVMFELEDSHWWFLAKRLFLKAVLPKPSGNLSILDIGSGTGGLTKYLQKWGKVYGLESSPFASEFLLKRKVNYMPISIMDYDIPKEKFDLIVICDVLYHKNITDDNMVIQKAYKGLKRGGLLLITDSAWKSLFSNHDRIMEARERYSLNEMVNKVKNNSFIIKKKTYSFFFLFPLFIIERVIAKKRKFETVKKVPKVLNSLLLFVCRIESIILKKISLPYGSSIIVLAQKL